MTKNAIIEALERSWIYSPFLNSLVLAFHSGPPRVQRFAKSSTVSCKNCAASMGISVYPEDAGDVATLMKHADMAMYSAKQAGKNAFRFYAAGDTPELLAGSRIS